MQQARPMLTPVLLALLRYMQRPQVNWLHTVNERVEGSRDISLSVAGFHAMQRGLDLSCALTAQVLSLPGGEGLISNLHFGEKLRDSSLVVVVQRDRECHELCPVRGVQVVALAATSVGWALRGGYMFPKVEVDGSGGRSPWTPADMTSALQSSMDGMSLAEGPRYPCIPSS